MDFAGLVTLLVFLKEIVCVPDTETVVPTSCQSPLGLANDAISPLAGVVFTASEGVASDVRLNGPAAWTLPEITSDSYLQVTLPRPLLITGIETQGSPVEESWIVSLRMQFSKDCVTFVNYTRPYWTNTSNEVTLTRLFHNVTVARCIRVIPMQFAGVRAALRLELLGCEVESCQKHLDVTSQEPLTDASGRTGIMTRLQSESIMTSLVVSLSTPAEHDGANLRIEYSRTCSEFVPLEDDAIGRVRVQSAENPRQTIEISLLRPVRAQCLRVSISQDSVLHSVNAFGCGTSASNGPLSGCGQTRQQSGRRRKRVVGGDPIMLGDMPWLVSLQFLLWHDFTHRSGFPHLCGASLIADQWLLSAAHCFDRNVFQGLDDPANWRIALGEHDQNDVDGTEQFPEIENIFKHPNFTFSNGPIVNDIALVKLKQPVVLSDYVNPICLDTVGEFPAGSLGVVAGWGQKTADTPGTKMPFKAVVPIQDSDDCREKFESLPDGHEAKEAVRIDDSVFCAAALLGGKDACLGDSGGPFSCEKDGLWYQVGVVSLGYGCGDMAFPGIYTRIPYFSDWIQDTMDNN
ncbi:transmembrane protease serine 11D-like [Gigantopelta aegis]|uniref:transmembrane protease serine 11D-like n=1 Tax=Gigantopelta aegis TaxID=1735272 RepID=UPI001B8873A6|nr:transmembrane protease serine 11D-like [Gigantopelta aegis]